jgi:hypothetical protein
MMAISNFSLGLTRHLVYSRLANVLIPENAYFWFLLLMICYAENRESSITYGLPPFRLQLCQIFWSPILLVVGMPAAS